MPAISYHFIRLCFLFSLLHLLSLFSACVLSPALLGRPHILRVQYPKDMEVIQGTKLQNLGDPD